MGVLPESDGATLRPWIAEARSNWLWLAEISTWEKALDLGSGDAAQMPGLAEHFTTVHCLRLDRRLLGRTRSELTARGYANIEAACATPVELPYRDGVFDCVVLDDVCARALATARGGSFGATLDRLLQECHRTIRRGGCLCVGISTPHWWGRFFGLKYRLTFAGFSLVRVYGAEPSYDEPRWIIPMDRRAVLAYEHLGREASPHGPLRSFLAWLGLRCVLYPSRIYLAYA